MATFEELGVGPDLVEALAAEGIERPSAFQESAIPVLLRGNSLMAGAGAGAGTLVAYGIPLLQTVDPEANAPLALVLVPGSVVASRLAESLSRLGQITGHKVAALGTPWALPGLASILFAAPGDLLREVSASGISLEPIRTLVVDGYGALQEPDRKALDTLMEILPREGQRVVLGQPLPREAEAFARSHLHKAIHIPPRSADGGGEDAPPRRGEVAYRITPESKDLGTLETVADALDGGAHHVLLFFHSEDHAADVGDFLAIHGYLSGAPGETEFPVWLGVEEMSARQALGGLSADVTVVTVSVDVPTDPDALDRRHGGGGGGVILARAREIPHLKDLAKRTGYGLVPARDPLPTRVQGELDGIHARIRQALKEEDLAPYFLALEPLFERHAPAEIAAAALLLLERKQEPSRSRGAGPAAGAEGIRPLASAPKTWVRLFVGVGDKEGIGPGDLLGAIAGEAGVDGSQVGKIEIRETFSLVEVISGVAERVIRGLNGTTIRGRSVRCDYDRGGPGGRGGAAPRSGRSRGRGGTGPRSESRDRPRRRSEDGDRGGS